MAVADFSGLDDARSKRGIFARGKNVYANGTNAATTSTVAPALKEVTGARRRVANNRMGMSEIADAKHRVTNKRMGYPQDIAELGAQAVRDVRAKRAVTAQAMTAPVSQPAVARRLRQQG